MGQKIQECMKKTGWFKHENDTLNKPNKDFQSQKFTDNFSGSASSDNNGDSLLDMLFKEEQQDMAAIGRLKQNTRKKKRKGHSL